MSDVRGYLGLVLAWVLYFTVHSVMASVGVKKHLVEKGMILRTQRLVYSLISILGLLALLFFNGSIGGDRLIPKTDMVKLVAMIVAGGGTLIINAAFKQYSIKEFLGLVEMRPSTLNKSGVLEVVRHPIYLGTILITIGFFFYDPRVATLVSTSCILLYLPIGISQEENKLEKEFGQAYFDYKQNVPCILPDFRKLFKKITQ